MRVDDIEDDSAREDLRSLCESYRATGRELIRLKKIQEDLKEECARIAEELGDKEYVGVDWKLQRVETKRTTISELKLLSAGVSMAIVKKCREVKKSSSWKVSGIKNRDEEGDE